MARYPGFIGPTGTERSVNVDAERTINFFPRILAPGTPKAPIVLYGTPGLRVFCQPDTRGPVRALWHQDNRVFSVVGQQFVEVFADQTWTARGTVAVDDNPATICSNGVGGFQVFVTSGGRGYIYDLNSNVLTEITDAGFPVPVRMGGYSDGYFFALTGGTHQFQISSLNNGLLWDATDVAQVSASSNNVLALVIDHREIWLFGSKTSEVWYNTGNADFPFGPIQGVFVEHGILAPYSAVKLDNAIFWVGTGEPGGKLVWRMQGYTPLRISTHAVEVALGRSTRLSEAIAYAYQDEGHAFYVLYVPDLDTTWVYDVATRLWHERAKWNVPLVKWEPHVSRCHCEAFGKHLVGDRETGAIYHMSLEYFDEEVPAA